jgi:hypothetical protein
MTGMPRRFGLGRRRVALCAVAVAVAIVLAGAGCDQGSVSAEQTELAELVKRPDVDQITARYKEMYAKIRQTISAAVPSAADWQDDGDGGSSGCGGEFSSVTIPDARAIGLPNWATAPIPGAEWTRTINAVDQVVRGYGFNSGPSAAPNRQYVTGRPTSCS